jgi:hypothetical protein
MPTVATLLGALVTFLALNSGLFVTVTTTNESQAPAHNFVATQRKFSELVSAGSGPVLVVVDNIDRLTAEDALTALREIRSLIEVPGSRCVFLIPIDRSPLVTQLRRQLGGGRASRDFLDKFFNVDIPLTDPEVVDLRDWVRRLAKGMFASATQDEISELAQVVILGCGRSPRAAKRIMNGVYARDRLMDANLRSQLTLQKLAVIESLLVRFPNSLRVLLDQPRRFTDMRKRDVAWGTGTPEGALAREAAGTEAPAQLELMRLLQGTREIDLTPSDIRAALSLREEREWRSVGDAAAIAQALEAGDGASLRKILEPLDTPSRSEALSRCVEWIRKSATDGYRIFAFNGLNAAAAAVDPASTAAAPLRSVGLEMLKGEDFSDAVTRLTEDSLIVIFGGADHVADKGEAWRKASAMVSVEVADSVLPGLVRLIRRGVDFASDAEVASVQSRLASFGPSALEPLFASPVDRRLVAGDIGSRYASDLVALELVAGNVESWLTAGARLRVARASGWSVSTMVAPIAQRLAAQLSAVTEIGSQAEQLIEDLVTVISGYSGGLSALVTALVSWTGPQRVMTMAWAARFNAKDFTAPAKQQVESWITATEAENIRLFADRSVGAQGLPSLDPARLLANRWLAAEDPQFAALSLLFEPKPQKGSAVVAAIEAATVAVALARFPEAIEVAASASTDRVPGLVTGLTRLIRETPIDSVPSLDPIMDKLEQASGNLTPSGEAYKTRVAASTRAELPGLAALGESLGRRLPEQAASLTHEYVEHTAVSAYVPLESLTWLGSADSTDVDVLIGVLGGAIRRGEYSSSALLPSLLQHRRTLRADSSIRAALGVLASKRTSDCADAEALLTEAREWNPCAGQELDELDNALTIVANACPNCADAIASLRAVRREKPDDDQPA